MTTVRPTSSRSLRDAEQHARRMHLLVAGAATAAAALVYLGVLLAARDRLPDSMATHFGLSGRADDFMPTDTALWVQGAAVLGVPLLLLVVLARGQWWRGVGARPTTALVAGVGTGLTALFVAITRAHVDISDPASVSITWQTAVLALGVGAVVATAAALILPRALPRPPAQPVEPLRIAPSDSVSWFGRASSSRWMLGALAIAVVALSVLGIVSDVWWLWLVALGVVVLILGVSSFAVTIDRSGVTWRSALGVPRGHVALSEIQSAAVVEVTAGDFGGFGVRALPGRLGLITRTGPALSVTHSRGTLVITVDEADTAASVVEGLRLRARR